MTNSMGHSGTKIASQVLRTEGCSGITPMQLLKLVFISHGWMLGLYGRPLISDSVEAWQYGPVIPSVYHSYKRFGSSPITDIPAADVEGLTAEERHVINQVCRHYAKFSGLQLSALTHTPDSPWDITRKLSGLGSVISNDLIEQHYRQIQTRGPKA